MAKYVLNSKNEEPDFVLIGLMSQHNVYGAVSAVNSALGIDLRLSDHIPYNLKEGRLFHFSLFHCVSEELGLEYYFIPNSSNFEMPNAGGSEQRTTIADLFSETEVEESTRLIKELPRTNYFLILKGEDLHLYQFKIIERLKTLPDIAQVQSIEPRDLPSRMNLVF